MHMYALYAHIGGAHSLLHTLQGGIECPVLVYHAPPYSYKTRSLTESGGRLAVSKDQESSCLHSPGLAFQAPMVMSGFLHECQGFELRSSGL